MPFVRFNVEEEIEKQCRESESFREAWEKNQKELEQEEKKKNQEKRAFELLRNVIHWVIQDSSELSETKRKLEEMGFAKEEYELLGFPEFIKKDEENKKQNSKFDICSMLTLSMDYASCELQMDMLNNGLTNKLGGVTIYHYEYGYEIHMKPCKTEKEWENWLAGIDPRLHRLLRIAHEQQCSILRLDEDGPVIEDLLVFAEN